MASRALLVLAVIAAVVVGLVLTLVLVKVPMEEEPDPFHMTMLSDVEVNGSDPGLIDAAIWIAVAAGEPRPMWDEVDVTARAQGLCETLAPPVLRVVDVDADGHLSEGDVLHIRGLSAQFAEGDITLSVDEEVIGKVDLHHDGNGQSYGCYRDEHGEHQSGALRRWCPKDGGELPEAHRTGLLQGHDLPQDHQELRGPDR